MGSPIVTMQMSRRQLLGRTAGFGAGALATSLFTTGAHATAPKFNTVEPGYITIAMSGTMPVTGMKNGQIVGSDAEMIVAIARRLGLGAKPAIMAWSATIEAIRSGRADIMCGDMGWTKARARAMLLTDAIYYDTNFITMKKDRPFTNSIAVSDLSGHSVGTGTGYSYVPEIKKIPGVTAVKLYDSVDACVRDVVAGRLDFAVLDSMTVDYLLLQDPSVAVKQVPLKPNTDYPDLSGRGWAVMGMNLENPDLFDAVNAGVKWLWASKTNAKLLAKNGMVSPAYLVAPNDDPRIGVDRDGKGNILGPAAHTPKDFSSLFA